MKSIKCTSYAMQSEAKSTGGHPTIPHQTNEMSIIKRVRDFWAPAVWKTGWLKSIYWKWKRDYWN